MFERVWAAVMGTASTAKDASPVSALQMAVASLRDMYAPRIGMPLVSLTGYGYASSESEMLPRELELELADDDGWARAAG